MKQIVFLTATVLVLSTFISAQHTQQPIIKKSVFFGKTIQIKEMDIVLPGEHPEKQRVVRNFFPGKKEIEYNRKDSISTILNFQRHQGSFKGKGPTLNFEGIDNVNSIYPADPNGDVSVDYYMQAVNSSFAVWDKSGNLIYGPVDYKSLWASLPGPWSDFFWGDPVFKYDQMADRWVTSSVAVDITWQSYNYEMVAVSETSDPLGAYYCYVFQFELINDYPKLAIWPDGYYITYNMYDEPDPDAYLYSLVTVVDRAAMLAGEPDITMIEFEIPDPDTERFFPMAADLRGETIPANEPCFIVTVDNHNPEDPWELSLDIYEFQPNWLNPQNSQFGITAQFDLGTFEPLVYYGPGAIQKGSTKTIMTTPLFLMYPVTYRAFTDHGSLVCCHTACDGNIYYIKWYELRKEGAIWYVYQSGDYAPGEDLHYYYPSLSINGNGDIALGYTVSSEEIYPSIRFTGRREGDSLGIMTFQEIDLFKGLNYANTYTSMYDQNRWGDYASMMVDPSNDTTFWFTNMYPKSQATSGNWGTRIFKINLLEEFEPVSSFAGNDTLICYNDYLFIAQGEATNYNAIQWTTTGDGSFVIDDIPQAHYIRGGQDLANGQVQLIIEAYGYEPGNTATDTMTLFFDPCTGIEELKQDEQNLSITPNPSNGKVTVNANIGINKNVILLVHDSQGKQLFTEEKIINNTIYRRILDFSLKDNGIYYVKLQAGEKAATGKIVVVK